ncbi:MerR family transcriptional regulator [Candidatus Bathyarchaeota archaeon]|nr:MerR family transcriptional regulator [Candidatus Bathyarchaeota archaeon]
MAIDQIPIGKFSFITRLSIKALRYYDEKGILTPKAKDNFTGYRYYTGDQIADGIKIKTLTGLGFTLDETLEIMQTDLNGDYKTIEKLIDKKLTVTKEEIKRLENLSVMLRKGRNEMMKMTLTEPVIKETQPLRVISKREKGSYGKTIGKLIGELMQCLYSPENQRNFVKMVGPIMTIYHDQEFKDEDADIEVAVPISGKITAVDPKIEIKNIPTLKVVSLIHKGSYETISQAYAKLDDYVRNHDLKYSGPIMDVYLNDPNKVDKDDILTEVQAQIK